MTFVQYTAVVLLMIGGAALAQDVCTPEIYYGNCMCQTGEPCGEKSGSALSADFCEWSPCMNGGTCRQGVGCDCSKGYYGEYCERALPCSSNPCYGSSMCSNTNLIKYNCICAQPDGGKDCINHEGIRYEAWPWQFDCMYTTCQNGGSCLRNSDGEEMCDCASGYFGTSCQMSHQCEVMCEWDQTCVWGWGMAYAECAEECEAGAPGCGAGMHVAGAGAIKAGLLTVSSIMAAAIVLIV